MIDVTIATLNSASTIERRIESIKANVPARSIVVVDGGSGDGTVEIGRPYARRHPGEKITIIGNITHPATYEVKLPNVEVVPFVNRSEMPAFYRHHKRLIRMTTEDGLPRMLHEALLCGLEVLFNGEEVKTIPRETDPAEFSKSFLQALDEKWGTTQTK